MAAKEERGSGGKDSWKEKKDRHFGETQKETKRVGIK